MEIISKINKKNGNIYEKNSITIAFLGDSVTQGCFECYFDDNGVQTIFDSNSAYPTRVKEILNILYPSAQINIINSGISGDNAVNGNNRFERDVAPYKPDLIVVSFGINDACGGKENIGKYVEALIYLKKQRTSVRNVFSYFRT
ncbi:MAG: SGNH/GDSL hydrolase family protein [Candidatus Borkfalkiaceae bacterium]|nr:SGNH/GDSL hydrolase family protein [Christensenellaceae bacterium]